MDKTYTNYGNYPGTEITLPIEAVNDCSHSGQCEEDVEYWLGKLDLTGIDPESLKKELSEYGAWSNDELSDHTDNLRRWIWISAGNIKDEMEG